MPKIKIDNNAEWLANRYWQSLSRPDTDYLSTLIVINRDKYPKQTCIEIFTTLKFKCQDALADAAQLILYERFRAILGYCIDQIEKMLRLRLEDYQYQEIQGYTNFNEDYKIELLQQKKLHGAEYSEVDFLKTEIQTCKDIIADKILAEYTTGKKKEYAPFLDEIKELYKVRIFKWEKKIHELENRIDPYSEIAKMQTGQGKIEQIEVVRINEIIGVFIKDKFLYFTDKYKGYEYLTMLGIFKAITYQHFEIMSAEPLDKAHRYLLLVNTQQAIENLNDEIKGLIHFADRLLANDPKDFLKFVVFFKELQSYYDSLCNNYNFNFSKSVFGKPVQSLIDKLETDLNTYKNLFNQDSKEPTVNDTKEVKLSVSACALMHVYLSMFNGQAITQQNKHKLAKDYGHTSGDFLRNKFTHYQNEEKRIDIHDINRKSALNHLARYNSILPLLKSANIDAFKKAEEDLKRLQQLFNNYHKI